MKVRLHRRGPVFQVLVVDHPQGDEAPGRLPGAHPEQHILGLSQGGVYVGRVPVPDGRNLVGCVDQPPHDGGLGDDLGVILRVGRGRGHRHQAAEVGHTAHHLQLLRALELPGQGHLVNGLVALEQRLAGDETRLVPFPVEVVGPEQRRDAGEALPVDQQGPDNRCLGLQIVRKQFLRIHPGALLATENAAPYRPAGRGAADRIRPSMLTLPLRR